MQKKSYYCRICGKRFFGERIECENDSCKKYICPECEIEGLCPDCYSDKINIDKSFPDIEVV